MAVKHRKSKQRTTKIATIGAATATVTALTVGVAQPAEANAAVVSRDVALSAATGPNYTQIITDSSDSLNNILFAAGNFGGAAAGAWDPIASAFPAGWLPTFDAGTTQQDLLTTQGLAAALTAVLNSLKAPDLSAIPGLPANDAADLTTALQVALAPLSLLTGVGTDALDLVNTALGQLGQIPLVGGLPSLGSLIPGLQVTDTSYESSYNWALLGLSGQTNINNLFAQIPSLTGTALVNSILSTLTIGGLSVGNLPLVDKLKLDGILGPLDIIKTPSLTVWDPSGAGDYKFPLGGEIGWLATMPVLDVGPLDLTLPIVGSVVSTTDTVVAIPIFAGGVALPLNLATFATVATPGLVLPTATGVSTLLGTNLQSFAIPLLGVSYTSLNTLQAGYVGTNGFNFNSGQTVGLLTTPLGVLPIVYSLGSVNAGTTGFGFTLPSLFTIGALPHFQVGTAPTQQSPDGLIPADVLNLGLDVPTQTDSITHLLGLPDVGKTLSDSVLTPVFNATAAPLGAQLTNYLNNNVGSWADGFANFVKQLTAAIANASYNLPGATKPEATASTLAVTSTPQTGLPTLPSAKTLSLPSVPSSTTNTGTTTANSTADEPKSSVTDTTSKATDNTKKLSTSGNTARDRVNTSVKQINDTAKNATKQISDTAKEASDNLNNIAKKGQDAVKKTVAGATQGAKDTADKAKAGASSK
ncbi:hypothetical protein [Mycolicibacterium brisbanense]|uniref:Uncharacterized protein n=1 Tax=Mycolicibacterium brisbanense TaxID=146020 RepID=A0A100VUG9_9MYCO|nr:hypothetical protein [Mycolicibacterium brisbanense]MCV7161491.1 hypothetical protein [Mycolicibacterium brisbanense]GAS86016.1 uncharacterized protein RMCB_0112 [Mycolicibacterium brisbanense]